MTKKLLVAVGLALIAMLALWLYSRSLQEEVAGGQKVTILVAGEDLPAGSRLAKANLAVRDVPEAYVHQSSIRKGEENQIIGRPVADKISQGQPLLWSRLRAAEVGDRAPAVGGGAKGAARAHPARRPVGIARRHAAAGRPRRHPRHLRPRAAGLRDGDAAAERAGAGDRRGARLGRERGADAAGTPGPRTFNNITVSVDPEEAELLVFAMQRGPINVALRSQDDVATFDDVPEKNFGDIFEQKRRADFVAAPRAEEDR